jgi:hypothetical protein
VLGVHGRTGKGTRPWSSAGKVFKVVSLTYSSYADQGGEQCHAQERFVTGQRKKGSSPPLAGRQVLAPVTPPGPWRSKGPLWAVALAILALLEG